MSTLITFVEPGMFTAVPAVMTMRSPDLTMPLSRAAPIELARSTSTAELQREARRIGYVRPGEQLFIIQGITAWRRASKAGAPSMRGGG